MAKSTAIKVIRVPSLARRGGKIARRGASAAGRAALTEQHTIAAVVAAGVAGYLARPGGSALPHIRALGIPGTYGLVAWAYGRHSKNRTAQHVATGLLSVAVYSAVQAGSFLSGDEEDGV